MADIRKLVLVALVTIASFRADAQSTPTCSVYSANPVIRAEGYSELMGDIILECTGGTPTALGEAVPMMTLLVYLDLPLTSRITDPNVSSTSFIEALAIIDEPNSSFTFNSFTNLTWPVLACGSTAAPFDQGPTNRVCTILSNGVPSQTYNGTAGASNVFQGRLLPNTGNSGNTGLQFMLPIDPPGPGNALIIRLTNIRVNAVQASGGSVTGLGVPVYASVALPTPSLITLLNNTVQTATIRNGIGSVQ